MAKVPLLLIRKTHNKENTMKTIKQMMVAVVAAATALLTNAVFAETLDLGGAARTVTDVSELAAYDGVTNSSGGDPATLTFNLPF